MSDKITYTIEEVNTKLLELLQAQGFTVTLLDHQYKGGVKLSLTYTNKE